MSKTYVMPDLHGRYDLMCKALESIESRPSGGTVVFLGDYIDRGPHSRSIVQHLMDGPPDGWDWVCLKGNHEDMMVETLGGPDEEWWLGNGGTQTLESYGGSVPKDHLEWCKSLPTWHDDGKRIFVHAGVDPTKDMHEQSEAVLLWMRYQPRNADVSFPRRHVIHGHTPEMNGPMFYGNRTNLDAGAVFTGRLVVAVFDDEKDGGPVEIREFKI